MTGRTCLASVLFLCGSLMLSTSPGLAQEITGRVVDAVTDASLPGVVVVLVDSTDTRLDVVEADSAGRFRFLGFRPGRHRLLTQRLGYGPISTGFVMVTKDDHLDFEIRMSPEPVRLDPIEATVERRSLKLESLGFYQRKLSSGGYLLDAEQIRDRSPLGLGDLLNVLPGIRGTGSLRTGCSMLFVLNGQRIKASGPIGPIETIDAFVHPEEIIGLEVYPGAGGIGAPIQYRGPDAFCGIVLVWTR